MKLNSTVLFNLWLYILVAMALRRASRQCCKD